MFVVISWRFDICDWLFWHLCLWCEFLKHGSSKYCQNCVGLKPHLCQSFWWASPRLHVGQTSLLRSSYLVSLGRNSKFQPTSHICVCCRGIMSCESTTLKGPTSKEKALVQASYVTLWLQGIVVIVSWPSHSVLNRLNIIVYICQGYCWHSKFGSLFFCLVSTYQTLDLQL
jgi:hypothetical protein